MTTNLTNTFGVYENFKKQPHAVDAMRYGSIATPDVGSNQANVYAVIEAINGAAGLVTSQIQAKEELRKAEGLKRAQELIKSTSEKDKVELGVRELLQKSGAIDLVDNIYATAALEKDVGKTMSNLFSLQYKENLTLNESYAKTREEQIQHFNDERKAFYDKIKTDRGSLNQMAFDEGFNETFAVDENSVFNLHTKWHSEKSKSEALSTLQLNLLSFDYDAGIADGSYSQQIGEFINTARIAGISEEQVTDVLSKSFQAYLAKGGSNSDIIEHLWNTNVGIWRTGEKAGQPKTYGDMIGDPQVLKDAMAVNGALMKTERAQEIDKAFNDAILSSPEKVQEVFNGLSAAEKKVYAGAKLNTKLRLAQTEQQNKIKAQTAAALEARTPGIIKAQLSRAIRYGLHGALADSSNQLLPTSIAEIKVPKPNSNGTVGERSATKEEVWEALSSMDYEAADRLEIYNLPLFSVFNKDLKDKINQVFMGITPDLADNPVQLEAVKKNLTDYTEMYKANPVKFTGVYGEEAAANMAALMYFHIDKPLNEALVMQANWRRAHDGDEAWQREARKTFVKGLNDTTSITLRNLNGKEDTISIQTASTLYNNIDTYGTGLIGGGVPPSDAVQQALDHAAKTTLHYKYENCHIFLPASTVEGTGYKPKILEVALDSLCAELVEKEKINASDVTGRWDAATRTVRISVLGRGRERVLTLQQLKNQYDYVYGVMKNALLNKEHDNTTANRAHTQAQSSGWNVDRIGATDSIEDIAHAKAQSRGFNTEGGE